MQSKFYFYIFSHPRVHKNWITARMSKYLQISTIGNDLNAENRQSAVTFLLGNVYQMSANLFLSSRLQLKIVSDSSRAQRVSVKWLDKLIIAGIYWIIRLLLSLFRFSLSLFDQNATKNKLFHAQSPCPTRDDFVVFGLIERVSFRLFISLALRFRFAAVEMRRPRGKRQKLIESNSGSVGTTLLRNFKVVLALTCVVHLRSPPPCCILFADIT